MPSILSDKINPTYDIDSAFDTNKAFKYTPPPEIDFSKLPLQEHWLQELTEICCQFNKELGEPFFDKRLQQPFEKHLQNKSLQENFTEKLKIIYHRLKGNLDDKWGPLSSDDRSAILAKLSEEVDKCTDGFHNRINYLIDSWQQPQTLHQLLYKVRKAMVDKVAISLIEKVQPLVDSKNFIYEVHIWNQTSIIASIDGLGVKANLPDDRFSSDLIDVRITEVIRQALQQEFSQQFTPFNLPNLLISELKTLIPKLQIEKRDPDGIRLGTREKITDLITLLLPDSVNLENSLDWQKYFIIHQDKEDPLNVVIKKLDTNTLYQYFYQALIKQKYFDDPKIHNFIDAAYCQAFDLSQEDIHARLETIILKFLSEKRISDLFQQLEKIRTKFPDFYKKLVNHEALTKNIHQLIPYLKETFVNSNTYLLEIIHGLQLLTMFDSSLNDKQIVDIANMLSEKNLCGSTLFMFSAFYSSNLINRILLFLKLHQKTISTEIIQQLFLEKDSEHWNVFMIAAYAQPSALKFFLKFLEKTSIFENSKLQEMLLTTTVMENYNILMVAANKQVEAVKAILSFLTNNTSRLTNIFGTLFTGKSNNMLDPEKTGDDCNKVSIPSTSQNTEKTAVTTVDKNYNNVLMIAMYNNQPEAAEAINAILGFIIQHIPEMLQSIFSQKDPEYNDSILQMAIRRHPRTIVSILSIVKEYAEFFTQPILDLFFFEKNKHADNALMLAARNHPSVLKIILDFFTEHLYPKRFNLAKWLFEQDNSHTTALIMAAENTNPTNLKIFLDFLATHIVTLGSEAIHKLLFNKINDYKMSLFTSLLWGGFADIKKSVVTLAAEKPDKIQELLNFIDNHINHLSNDTLIELFSEKELLKHPFFIQICSLYPYKNILRSLATSAKTSDLINEKYKNSINEEEDQDIKGEQPPLTQFLLKQLLVLNIDDPDDKELSNKLLLSHSVLLLTNFDKKYFITEPSKLAYVTEQLYQQYIVELKDREKNGPKYTRPFSFFQWRYSANNKLKATEQLNGALTQTENRLKSLVQFQTYNSALTDGRLGKFLDAYITITEQRVDRSDDALMALEKIDYLPALAP